MKLVLSILGSCKFSCFLTEDFTYHITLEHQNCDKYSCYLCERKESVFFASQPHEMIDVSPFVY